MHGGFRLYRSSRPIDSWESTASVVHDDCLDGTLGHLSHCVLMDAALRWLEGRGRTAAVGVTKHLCDQLSRHDWAWRACTRGRYTQKANVMKQFWHQRQEEMKPSTALK